MKIGYSGGIGILAVICACGGKSSSGSEDVVASATTTLNIAITGQGMVTSPDGINCTGNCARPTTLGGSVHLDAMPASGMQFMGWSGACSGTGGCDLNISGETQVGASFATGPVTIQVQLVGTGSGRVTSAPAGIDCPGTCGMTVPPGTVITMSQTAGTGSSFIGWGGGCSGLSCVLTASATTRAIFANFGPPLHSADPCEGIVVPAVTPADLKTFHLTDSKVGCIDARTDLLGNLYVTADCGKPFVVSSTGHTVQDASVAASLRSGFTSVSGLLDPVRPPALHYQSYSPEGTLLNSFEIPNGPLAFAQNPNGGSVLASGKCDEGGATSTIQLFYFDDANTPTRTAKVTGQGCMGNNLRILVDTAGLTLLVYPNSYAPLFGVPARRSAARWIDASGRPVTDWFDAGPLTGMGFLMQPIIGGGAAIASQNWTFFPSGKAQAAQPPSVLALGGFGFQWIVLGGKAYAVVSPTTRAVIAPTGEICGQLPPLGDAMSTFFVGRDGTFMAFSQVPPGVVSYYPRLLK
jgi:hypothetical protein